MRIKRKIWDQIVEEREAYKTMYTVAVKSHRDLLEDFQRVSDELATVRAELKKFNMFVLMPGCFDAFCKCAISEKCLNGAIQCPGECLREKEKVAEKSDIVPSDKSMCSVCGNLYNECICYFY